MPAGRRAGRAPVPPRMKKMRSYINSTVDSLSNTERSRKILKLLRSAAEGQHHCQHDGACTAKAGTRTDPISRALRSGHPSAREGSRVSRPSGLARKLGDRFLAISA